MTQVTFKGVDNTRQQAEEDLDYDSPLELYNVQKEKRRKKDYGIRTTKRKQQRCTYDHVRSKLSNSMQTT